MPRGTSTGRRWRCRCAATPLEVAFPFHGLDVCVIGPSVRNSAAIRAYEKVGFTFMRDVVVPREPDPEHLMVVTREAVSRARRPRSSDR